MNIENRLNKLEAALIKNDSEVCECCENYFRRMADKVYNNVPFDETGVTFPESDYCRKCEKKVSESDLAFMENLEKIYG